MDGFKLILYIFQIRRRIPSETLTILYVSITQFCNREVFPIRERRDWGLFPRGLGVVYTYTCLQA